MSLSKAHSPTPRRDQSSRPAGRRNYQCETCTKSFTTSSHLSRHRRVHTGERNHICPYDGCQTRCARLDNLQQHYRIHLSPNLRRIAGPIARVEMAKQRKALEGSSGHPHALQMGGVPDGNGVASVEHSAHTIPSHAGTTRSQRRSRTPPYSGYDRHGSQHVACSFASPYMPPSALGYSDSSRSSSPVLRAPHIPYRGVYDSSSPRSTTSSELSDNYDIRRRDGH